MKQLVQPNMNQTSDVAMCAYFVFHAFGGKNGWGFQWARQAWDGQANKHVGAYPPLGISVPIWHDYWATLGGTYRNWGHVSIRLADGRVLSSPYPTYGNGQRIYPSVRAMEQDMGLGNYLGWTESLDGTKIVDMSMNSTQRQVGSAPVIRRADASTKSAAKEPQLEAGEIGNFDGWKTGESVNGNSVWFRGISGDWFWSGGFTSQSTSGLKNLNPAPAPATTERVVDTSGTNVRATARTNGALVTSLAGGTKVKVLGWVNGDTVSGNKVWYKLSNGFAWSGGFTSQSTTGLTDLNTVAPAPEPEPEEPPYKDFKAFSPVVTSVQPAHSENYMYGNFPAKQTDVVLHDFGTDGKDTFAGVLSWFKNPAAITSSHFVVSGDEIVQMVSLEDRAYHAGPNGNGFIGIEIDPAAGRAAGDPLRDKTVASVRKLLKALNEYYGVSLRYRKHPEFMDTKCGDDIHFDDYDLSEPKPEPTPTPEPGDNGLGEKIDGLSGLIQRLIDLLKSIFKIN